MRTARLALALGVLNLAVLAWPRAPAPTEVVRARRIELVDDAGVVRAQLTVEDDREVVFRLRDPSGTVRAKLGASAEGSGLLLTNAATEPGVHLLASGTAASMTVRAGERRRVIEP
jgi:hypothetical protein